MNASILQGDVLDRLHAIPNESVHCVVTSPPYWGLRDYGVSGQLGLESTPAKYISKMVAVFQEVRRVLRKDGTCWVNIGDSYTSGGRSTYGTWSEDSKQSTHTAIKQATRAGQPEGLKPKDLVGIPWRLAFALQADGWWLRQDIIWHKPNPMPESVTDRCTKAHEYIFLLSKSERYYYDADAIKETAIHSGQTVVLGSKSLSRGQATGAGVSASGNGLKESVIVATDRNKRSVWTVPTQAYPEAHFATFPEELIVPCILAGCPIGGTVLDPFSGSGTTGVVALRYHREYIGIELNPEYAALSEQRITGDAPLFNVTEVTV